MNVQVLGCSYRNAPIAFRERLSFAPDQARSALISLRRQFPASEAVLLSTCNRVELYTASENDQAPTNEQITAFLATYHGLDRAEVSRHVYDFSGRDSVHHLFVVASSLDSMVLGEPQISSQVRSAYELATQQKATGPLTHAAFQTATKVSRRVARETAVHEHRVSIPSVAVAEFAARIFERFDDKQALVIGAGEMAEETLTYLLDEGVQEVTIVNRSRDRAVELARRFQGVCVPWEGLSKALIQADLVISTTGSERAIVTKQTFRPVHLARGPRPLFVLDLAVPRDFDPDIGRFEGVYLYAVDDLQAACELNRNRRERELPKALAIVEDETNSFMTELHFRATSPVVRRLRQQWAEPKEAELKRLLRKLPHLAEDQQAEISQAFDRLTKKLLHPALESLRSESRQGVPTALMDAVAKLFQFKD